MKSAMKRATIKYLVIFLIVILPLLLGASCLYIETSPPPPSPSSPQTSAPTVPDWTLPPLEENSAPDLPDFVQVVAKVKPSVVAINTEVTKYNIFNQPFTEEQAGSGWIIDEKGYIITNNHVVEGADSITVILDDGQTFPAGIVGTDPLTDLAVIKIDAEELVKANVGDSSKLRIGEWVLAIGNSLNLGVTPSEGIIRSSGASVPVSAGQTLYGLIGTSAPINPGNSGGPLVNMQGEVIGITTIKIAMVGVEGMGWAISTKTAMPIIEELINRGYVVRPWLGVVVSGVNQYLILKYDLKVSEGAFITEIGSDSPAEQAGLKPRDVIVSFSGKETPTAQELVQAIHSSQVGETVEIIFWRGDTKNTTYATLIERPQP